MQLLRAEILRLWNFLSALGLSGGMPTLVSVQKTRLVEAFGVLGVRPADVTRLVG